MITPLQISFHNMEPSTAVEDRIREEAALLDHFCKQIMSCRVVVDVPHRHQETARLYQVRVDLKVPGEEIAVGRKSEEHAASKDIQVAIRDAFDAAARKLEDYARRQRRDVKRHEAPSQGRISKLFSQSGYGFIETSDQREIYFHANGVLDAKFEDLEIGDEVTFDEELGDKGPQASTVRALGSRHHAS